MYCLNFINLKAISLESLEYSQISNELDRSNIVDLNISLDDYFYETISLGDDDNTENLSKSSKRLTWEEWYVKKKLDALKNKSSSNISASKGKSSKSRATAKELRNEEEKRAALEKWWLEKQKQILNEREKLEKKKLALQQKKEEDAKRREKTHQQWFENVEKKEKEKREKKLEEERRLKAEAEEKKLKNLEAQKRMRESMKKIVDIRDANKKNGVVIINGKEYKYYDWSTSPEPSFVNKKEWVN